MKYIQTPARLEVVEQELAGHPDQQFAGYILTGLSQGFRIGFQHTSNSLHQAACNMLITEPRVVSNYARNELLTGRLME